ALAAAGVASIMINSNPETVSTDFDTSDRLYFEPLDDESVIEVFRHEGRTKDEGRMALTSQWLLIGNRLGKIELTRQTNRRPSFVLRPSSFPPPSSSS